MNKQKKIIIWTKGLDDFLKGEKKFNGGIAVQMSFWAKTFHQNNWKVYSLSENQKVVIEGIYFIKSPTFNKIGIFVELFSSLRIILKIKPDVIIRRGASRNQIFTAFWAKLFGVKLILMGASDTDFDTGKEIINREHDRLLYRKGVQLTNYFIAQNKQQISRLQGNYKKNNIIIIPNIWRKVTKNDNEKLSFNEYILWVANFHKRKRPEWFIELAKNHPKKQFVMVGGPGNIDFYNWCKSEAENVKNLLFLGPQDFWFTNSIFTGAKLFFCTSESEGFPNTFLQAWSNNIPVITTFDPSDVVNKKQLGIVVNSIDELQIATHKLLNDAELYQCIQENIQKYFESTHDSQKAYEIVIDKFNI